MAQLTQVTGTVKDPNGLPYSNGVITPLLVTSGTPFFLSTGAPYTPPSEASALDANGHFIVTLADVNQLTPAGETWTFHVCSGAGTVEPALGAGPVCFDVAGVVVTGPSMDISAQLSAAAKRLTVPLGGGGGWTALAGSHQIYVDASRTDSYTPTGSVNFPFKTIMGAVNQIIANGDNTVSTPYVIVIAPATYPENIDLSNTNLVHVTLASQAVSPREAIQPVVLTGNLTIVNSTMQFCSFVGLEMNQILATITSPAAIVFTACYLSVTWTITNAGVSFFDCALWGAGASLTNTTLILYHSQQRNASTYSLASGSLIYMQQGSYWKSPVTIPSGCQFFVVEGSWLQPGANVTVQSGGTLTARNAVISSTVTVQAGGSASFDGCAVASISGAVTSSTVFLSSGAIFVSPAPTVGTGEIGYGSTTAATASAGAGAAPPATVDGYMIVNVGGVTKKIPFYAN